jgi:TolB-like protein
MPRRFVLLSAALCLAVPCTAFSQEEISIAVMEFASKGGISEKQMDALGDLLANEIRELGNYRVIGKSDIRAAIDFEAQKTLLGCTDDACIAELGGALGVRYVVVGNISLFGDLYLLNLKILDVEKIRVAKGLSKKVTGGQSKLIDALSQAARDLMEGAGLQPGIKPAPGVSQPSAQSEGAPEETAPAPIPPPPSVEPEVEVEAEAESKAPSRPMNTWGHVTFWTGLGTTAVGVLAMIASMGEADVYKNSAENWKDRLDARDKSEMYAGLMWTGYALGAALMTTGILLWLMEPDETGTTATVGTTPDGQGMILNILGRW